MRGPASHNGLRRAPRGCSDELGSGQGDAGPTFTPPVRIDAGTSLGPPTRPPAETPHRHPVDGATRCRPSRTAGSATMFCRQPTPDGRHATSKPILPLLHRCPLPAGSIVPRTGLGLTQCPNAAQHAARATDWPRPLRPFRRGTSRRHARREPPTRAPSARRGPRHAEPPPPPQPPSDTHRRLYRTTRTYACT